MTELLVFIPCSTCCHGLVVEGTLTGALTLAPWKSVVILKGATLPLIQTIPRREHPADTVLKLK